MGRTRWALVAALMLALVAGLPARQARGKKYALLVGVKEYDHPKLRPLKYTENDVVELAKLLRPAGYEVTLLSDSAKAKPTGDNVRQAIEGLLAKKTKHDTVLVALAGHGLQMRVSEKEGSYFCPSDAQLNDHKSLVSLDKLFADLDACGAGVKLLLVDACRNELGERGAARNIDVDSVPRPPRGIAALFSCASGQQAFETKDLGKGHGVFFHFVLEGLRGEASNKHGEVNWSSLSDYVSQQVTTRVPQVIGGGAVQTPHEVKNLVGVSPVLLRAAGGDTPGGEKVVKPVENSVGMRFVAIELGGRVAKKYHLGVTEVTQEEYEKVMAKNPSWYSSSGGGKDKVAGMDTSRLPVDTVNWEEAKEFCDRLSKRAAEKGAGRKYRLPTEAEWEHACRAGATTAFSFGDDETKLGVHAWFGGNADGTPHPVATKRPNAWGLYDMHGGVAEWCDDWFDRMKSRKVTRGGSWQDTAAECRAGGRARKTPTSRGTAVGFRVLMTQE